MSSEEHTYQKVDCVQIIEDIVKTLDKPATFIIETNIQLKPFYAPRIPLQIVLQNLIINTFTHHHQPEQGHVTITAEHVKDTVIFRIKDNDPGIASAYHEKIFQVFQTLSPREETSGSSIGLSLVRRVLQRYGGTLKLYSQEGDGSTFEVIWPTSNPAQDNFTHTS